MTELVHLLQHANRKHICLFELFRKMEQMLLERDYLTREELKAFFLEKAKKIVEVQNPSDELIKEIFSRDGTSIYKI